MVDFYLVDILICALKGHVRGEVRFASKGHQAESRIIASGDVDSAVFSGRYFRFPITNKRNLWQKPSRMLSAIAVFVLFFRRKSNSIRRT